jgi:hypothetical protein
MMHPPLPVLRPHLRDQKKHRPLRKSGGSATIGPSKGPCNKHPPSRRAVGGDTGTPQAKADVACREQQIVALALRGVSFYESGASSESGGSPLIEPVSPNGTDGRFYRRNTQSGRREDARRRPTRFALVGPPAHRRGQSRAQRRDDPGRGYSVQFTATAEMLREHDPVQFRSLRSLLKPN